MPAMGAEKGPFLAQTRVLVSCDLLFQQHNFLLEFSNLDRQSSLKFSEGIRSVRIVSNALK